MSTEEGLTMHRGSSLSNIQPEYLRCFSFGLTRTPRRIQISSGGGISPAWSKNGDEIFYTHGDAMMAARVTTSLRGNGNVWAATDPHGSLALDDA